MAVPLWVCICSGTADSERIRPPQHAELHVGIAVELHVHPLADLYFAETRRGNLQAADNFRRTVRNDARQFVADGDVLVLAPIVHERYASGDRGLQHILLPPLGDPGRELLAALLQRPLVFRRFVFLLERQFHELLLRLDDLQLGRGERGVEPRLGVLLREVVLGRGFVVGGGDHGFGQKQRIPLQRAAAVVEILQQQRTLPFEFGVILAVLGDLFAQKLFLRAILSVAR